MTVHKNSDQKTEMAGNPLQWCPPDTVKAVF